LCNSFSLAVYNGAKALIELNTTVPALIGAPAVIFGITAVNAVIGELSLIPN
jgi:hypothetical protein